MYELHLPARVLLIIVLIATAIAALRALLALDNLALLKGVDESARIRRTAAISE